MAATLSNADMKLPDHGELVRDEDGIDCLSMAAKAASNINALLIAQGKLKPSQLSRPNPIAAKKKLQQVKKKFDAEVEINDAPIICRDILTRNSSQEEISKKSCASISTKGRYISPEKRATAEASRDRPLYLYIQAETEDNVQRAVLEINQIILKNGGIVNQTRGSTISVAAPVIEYNHNVGSASIPDLVNNTMTLVHAPQPDLSQPPPSHITGQSAASISTPQVQFIEEKMFIGLEHAPPSFNVRNMILGSEGSFLQHIHSTSGAVVTLRGRNSGYLDPKTAQESTEPMHIHLKHMTQASLERAKQLAGDLIKTVQNDYSQFQRQLALQPPAAAFQASVSMSHHVDHSATLVSRQRAAEGVVNYPTDQRVMFSSSGSPLHLAAPPLSHVQQPGSQMLNLSRPPTYVQAAPIHPLTTNCTLTQAVGYNSLTSQGVEFVRQTIPVSRPLASIQPLNPDVVQSVHPMLATPSHQVAIEASPTLVLSEAGPQAVPVSIHLAPSGFAGVQTVATATLSQPSPVVFTSQLPPGICNPPPAVLANQLPPPVTSSYSYPQGNNSHLPPPVIEGLPPSVIGGHPAHMDGAMASHSTLASVPPPVVTSQPPPVMTSVPPPSMTGMPNVSNQPLPVMTSIPIPVATGQPPPVITSMPPPMIIANHQESHVVIVSQSGAVIENEGHVPMISIAGPQPFPVMHKPPTETFTYIVQQPLERQLVRIDPPDVSVPPPHPVEHVGEPAVVADQPPVAVNEYGEPLEVVEIIQPRPHHMTSVPLPFHITGVPPPSRTNSVPRYACISSCTTQNSIPSLMDVEVHNSRHLPPPRRLSNFPPIEPPPHLADGYQGKRTYPGEYGLPDEHRPPYRGSRHLYSARSPPPPPSHNSTDAGPPRHKRAHNPSVRHPPPPPPPPI